MSIYANTVQKTLSILLFFIFPALLSAHGGEDVVCVVCKHLDGSQPKPAPSFDVLKVDVPDWVFNHPDDCFVGVSLPLHDATLAEQQALMFAGMVASRHDSIDDSSISMVSYNDGDVYQRTRSGRVSFDIPTDYQIIEKEFLSDGCLAILVRFSFSDGIRKMTYEYRDDFSSYHRNDSLSFDEGFMAECFSTDNFRITCMSELDSTSTYCVYYNDLKETCNCNAKVPCEYQYTARDGQPRSINGSLPDGITSFNIPIIGNTGYTLWRKFVYNEIESAVIRGTNCYSSPDSIAAKTNQAIWDKKITFEMGGWDNVYEYVVVRYDFRNKVRE